jgi:DNA-binding MarR family transcriptional regulator
VDEDSNVAGEARALQAALNRIVRWSTRPAVMEEVAGPAGAGLSPTDLWLLDGIVRQGPLRVTDLSTWQGVDKSTLTSQLRRLTGRGLVQRRSDPADARAVLVSSTADGRRLHEQVSRHGAVVLADLLADWPSNERMDLARLLTRFADSTAPMPHRR